MLKLLKYLLLPITIIFWLMLSYYSLYYGVLGFVIISSYRLIWILLLDTFIFGILYFIVMGVPAIMRLLIFRLFNRNLVIAILHSIAGTVGIVLTLRLFVQSPPMMVWEGGESFFLVGLWKTEPLKTIIIVLPMIGLFGALLYANIISPIHYYYDQE